MRWKVMVSAPYMQPILDRFKDAFEKHDIEVVVPPVNERLGEEELLKWIGDIDGVICGQGGEGFVRLNFACPRSILTEALDKMNEALLALA